MEIHTIRLLAAAFSGLMTVPLMAADQLEVEKAAQPSLLASGTSSAQILVKNGQKIAVLGDLVTRWDATDYPQQVIRGLEANGIHVGLIHVGCMGTTDKMLGILDEKVIAQKPDWMILNCGIDDAWGNRTTDQHIKDITRIVEKTEAAGIKVVLSIATMVGEDPDSHYNGIIAAYNTALRQLAREKKWLLADFDMPAALVAAGGGAKTNRSSGLLTNGTVFLNPMGNELLVLAILRTLGLDTAQIQKARGSWLDRTDLCKAKAALTVRQNEQLAALAAKEKRPASEVLGEMVAKALAARPQQ
jgi:lysophospholipase L1-like esterase